MKSPMLSMPQIADIAPYCCRHKAITIEHLSIAFGLERSWIHRRVAALLRSGAIGRRLLRGRVGRPRWVYGPQARRRDPRAGHTAHTLLRTEVLLNLSQACRKIPDLQLDYRLEDELPYRADPVPDAAVALTRGERASLFLVEIDRGTETICASHRGTRDLVGKVVAYAKLIDRNGFQDFAGEFGASKFSGLRMLLVTTAWSRVQSLERLLASRPENFGFVWATTFADATSEAILAEPIWKPMGEFNKRALIPSTQLAHKATTRTCARSLQDTVSAPAGPSFSLPNK